MAYKSESIVAADGTRLAVYRWLATKPVGHIVLAHGLGEHAGCYDEIASYFAQQLWSVHALDHRGHGRSAGVRGHVGRWTDYARDLQQLTSSLPQDGLKRMLLGHSMGGMIAVTHLLEYPGTCVRAALSAPANDVSIAVPPVKAAIGNLLSNLWPTLTLATPLEAKDVCSRASVAQAYAQDPLVHNKVSTRWFTEYFAMIERVKREAGSLRTPIAIWHGEADVLVAPRVSEEFYGRLQVEPRQRTVLPKLFHEVMFEASWQSTADAILDWFRAA